MNYDYAIHSDFLIHWNGKDIDSEYDKNWHELGKSSTEKNVNVTDRYIKRLCDILTHGLWMTSEPERPFKFDGAAITVPETPKTCFTELKVSESRKHARQYGRLGIGVKRPFVFKRLGRPLIYYGFHQNVNNDVFLRTCAEELDNKDLLNFFKPMNSSCILNYDFYNESEWRIIFFQELLDKDLIIDPRDPKNESAHSYFQTLQPKEQKKLKYLIPLDGWFSMIIYPSLDVKNKAQQDNSSSIVQQIQRIKSLNDHGNRVEKNNWPIEVDLDACRNF